MDQFDRTLTVDYLGKSSDPAHAGGHPYEYTATIDDAGHVRQPARPAHPQPGRAQRRADHEADPGGRHHDRRRPVRRLLRQRQGRPGPGPARLGSFTLNANPAYASPVWPELAFPAGTTFAGLNEAAYAYDYTVPAKTVVTYTYKWVNGHKVPVKHVRVLKAQDWKDTAFNGDGQLQWDGNVPAARPSALDRGGRAASTVPGLRHARGRAPARAAVRHAGQRRSASRRAQTAWASCDRRARPAPRARLPFFDLAPGCVPFGQGVIVLGLVSEAKDRDGIPHRDGRGARLQALPAPPEQRGRPDRRRWARRARWGGMVRDVYPRRDLVPGASAAPPAGVIVRWLIPSPSWPS